MNIRKSWLLSFLFAVVLSVSATAMTPPTVKGSSAVTEQITELLQGIDEQVAESTTVYVDFMINAKSEIIVVSTNNKNLDRTIKSKLNYKAINSGKLETFKKYTLPVSIQKK